MDDFVAILKTEYSAAFDEHRKKAMINSFYEYGPAKKNYGEYKCMDAMLEFMHPSIPGAKYTPTGDTTCEIAGFGVNQLEV